MNKKQLWLLLLIAPVFFIPLVIPFTSSELVLFPFPNDKKYSCEIYNDTADRSGKSIGTLDTTGSVINFNFTLRMDTTTKRDPYVAFYMTLMDSLSFKKDTGFLNISSYDSIRINLTTSKKINSFKIQLKTKLGSYTDFKDFRSYRIDNCEVIIKTDSSSCYSKSLKNDFKPAPFMFQNSDIRQFKPTPNYAKLFGIDIQTGSYALSADTISSYFSIDRISFVKESNNFLSKEIAKLSKKGLMTIICFLCCLIYILALLLIFRFLLRQSEMKKHGGKPDLPPHTHNDSSSMSEQEAERVVKFIEENYQDFSLSAENVALKITIPKESATKIIPGTNNKTILEYLYFIRIEAETKYLSDKALNVPMHSIAAIPPVSDQEAERVVDFFRDNFGDSSLNLLNVKEKMYEKIKIPVERGTEILIQYFGLPIQDYLKTIRIKVAKKIMEKNPDLPIKDIRPRVGLNDPGGFNHAFSDINENKNETPGDFQKKCKQKKLA